MKMINEVCEAIAQGGGCDGSGVVLKPEFLKLLE